jgi:hypothetical protein
MRLLTIALLTASGVALAAPAMAQDVYVGAGPRGVGIGVGTGPHYSHRDRDVVVERRGYGERRYGERRYVTDGYARGSNCRTTIIKRDGMVKKIRRCY